MVFGVAIVRACICARADSGSIAAHALNKKPLS